MVPARPCDQEGNDIGPNAPPPPKDDVKDFSPWADRPSFEFTELVFEKMQTSKDDLNKLLRIHAAKNILDGHGEDGSIFNDQEEMLKTIDASPYGESTWRAFKVRYTGPVTPNSPSWMRKTFIIYIRDTLEVVENLVASEDFKGKFDTTPYQEYLNDNCRVFSNLMSGQWAYKQAVRLVTLSVFWPK